MDIVFQPNGNFDEVYLYVGDSFSFTHSRLPPDHTGGAHGSRSTRNCEWTNQNDHIHADQPFHRFVPDSPLPTPTFSPSFTKPFAD